MYSSSSKPDLFSFSGNSLRGIEEYKPYKDDDLFSVGSFRSNRSERSDRSERSNRSKNSSRSHRSSTGMGKHNKELENMVRESSGPVSVSSRESRRNGERAADRFTRKLLEMEKLNNEMNVLKDTLKKQRVQYAELEKWIKQKMVDKTKQDKSTKVKVATNINVYTMDTNKIVKGRPPTQKKIRELLENYFNETDLCDFMAYPSSVKAAQIHSYLYGDLNRGYQKKQQFSRRKVLIK